MVQQLAMFKRTPRGKNLVRRHSWRRVGVAVSDVLEKIAARRAELESRIQALTGQLQEARAELDELTRVERVVRRLESQTSTDVVTPAEVQATDLAGPTLLRRANGMDEQALPPHYRAIVKTVREAHSAVPARQVCAALDVGVERRHIEGMRRKLNRLVGHGWLHKQTDGRFASPP